jgi:hypothetical protein
MDTGLVLCCDHHLLLLVQGCGLVCSCVVCDTVWHCQVRYASSTIDATVTGGTSKGQSEVAQLDQKDWCDLNRLLRSSCYVCGWSFAVIWCAGVL